VMARELQRGEAGSARAARPGHPEWRLSRSRAVANACTGPGRALPWGQVGSLPGPVPASPLHGGWERSSSNLGAGRKSGGVETEASGARPRCNECSNWWPRGAAGPADEHTCPLQPRCPTPTEERGHASTGRIGAPYARRTHGACAVGRAAPNSGGQR
jgi:hypothetical protein